MGHAGLDKVWIGDSAAGVLRRGSGGGPSGFIVGFEVVELPDAVLGFNASAGVLAGFRVQGGAATGRGRRCLPTLRSRERKFSGPDPLCSHLFSLQWQRISAVGWAPLRPRCYDDLR